MSGVFDWNTLRAGSAVETWAETLSRIEVEGGTARQKELFYTSLYRSLLWPALRSDVNGQYRDVDGESWS